MRTIRKWSVIALVATPCLGPPAPGTAQEAPGPAGVGGPADAGPVGVGKAPAPGTGRRPSDGNPVQPGVLGFGLAGAAITTGVAPPAAIGLGLLTAGGGSVVNGALYSPGGTPPRTSPLAPRRNRPEE